MGVTMGVAMSVTRGVAMGVATLCYSCKEFSLCSLSWMGVWSLIFSEIVFLNLSTNVSFLSSDVLLIRARKESNSLSKRSRLVEAPNRLFS